MGREVVKKMGKGERIEPGVPVKSCCRSARSLFSVHCQPTALLYTVGRLKMEMY